MPGHVLPLLVIGLFLSTWSGGYSSPLNSTKERAIVPAVAQTAAGQNKGDIDPKVIAAWKEAGAMFHFWWHDEDNEPRPGYGSLKLDAPWNPKDKRPQGVPGMPSFLTHKMQLPPAQPLPIPTVPFGLSESREGTGYLAKLPGLSQARLLVMIGMKLTLSSEDVKALATAKQLQSLTLRRMPIVDADLKAVAGLNQLQRLALPQTRISNEGLKELAGLQQLRELDLTKTQIDDTGLKQLAGFKQLQLLLLGDTQISDMGLKQLAGLSQLRALYLHGTPISDVGLKELAVFKQLRWLAVNDTQITDAGLKELAGLKQLETLDVRKTQVTDAGVAELQKALPKLKLKPIGQP